MLKNRFKHHLFICHGKSCSENGNPEQAKAFFKDKIKEHSLEGTLRACFSSCLNLCKQSPNMVVYPDGVWYSGVQNLDWGRIFNQHLLNSKPVVELQTKNEDPK